MYTNACDNTFPTVSVVYRVQTTNTKTHSKGVILCTEHLHYCFSRLTELHIQVPQRRYGYYGCGDTRTALLKRTHVYSLCMCRLDCMYTVADVLTRKGVIPHTEIPRYTECTGIVVLLKTRKYEVHKPRQERNIHATLPGLYVYDTDIL